MADSGSDLYCLCIRYHFVVRGDGLWGPGDRRLEARTRAERTRAEQLHGDREALPTRRELRARNAGAEATEAAVAAEAPQSRPADDASTTCRRVLRETRLASEVEALVTAELSVVPPASAAAEQPPVAEAVETPVQRLGRGHRLRNSVTKRTIVGAMIAAGVLVTTALPAAAITNGQANGNPTSTQGDNAGAQTFAVGVASNNRVQRDAYSSEPEAVAQADANMHTADTFTVNPDGVVLWPFPHGVPLTDPFGYRGGAYAGMHTGQDFAAGEGSPIRAIADGVVVDTDFIAGADGQHVVIQHTINGQTFRTVSAHMIAGSETVKAGDHVTAGEVIGFVGSTGAASGPHLHVDVVFGPVDNETFVDPWGFLMTFNAMDKSQASTIDFSSYIQSATHYSYAGGLVVSPTAPVAPQD